MQQIKKEFKELFWDNRKYIKIWVVRQILIVAILFWMVIIFGFSSADAEESKSTSDIITGKIITYIYTEYDELSDAKQQEAWHRTSFIVRKTGHFGEYAILGLMMGVLLITFRGIREHSTRLFWSEVLGVLYAVTDEIHQGFVDGRSPQIRDVFIDAMGFLSAILFIVLVFLLIKIMNNQISVSE